VHLTQDSQVGISLGNFTGMGNYLEKLDPLLGIFCAFSRENPRLGNKVMLLTIKSQDWE